MELKLRADRRTDGAKPNRLRAQGKLPAVVYGHRISATAVALDAHEFERVFLRAGRSHLVDLVIDGGRPRKVLVREVQHHPRRHGAVHVDLYQVDMREKIAADVPVTVVGESPAAKRGEADVVQMVNQVKVECLPGDLPEAIEVDVSGLENVGDVIRVRELSFPEAVAVQTDPEEVVVKNQPRRELAEEVPPEAAEQPEEMPTATSSEESPAVEGAPES